MKLMIASDLHGSGYWTEKLVGAFHREGAEKLLLLGDLLYHGPRNDLPERYDPRETAALLNGIADRILCVRGNCDAEVDQMMLDFPILSESCVLFSDGRTIFATHGHMYSETEPPKLHRGDVLLAGHTHLQVCREHPEGWIFMNPGSVSIPKEDSTNGYMTLEDGVFSWKDLDGNIIMNCGES